MLWQIFFFWQMFGLAYWWLVSFIISWFANLLVYKFCSDYKGLPTKFCEDHLPNLDSELVLEDEDGNEYDSKYIAKRTGLSGGWRAFALEHKLDDGDALVFELVEPTRFKVGYIQA